MALNKGILFYGGPSHFVGQSAAGGSGISYTHV